MRLLGLTAALAFALDQGSKFVVVGLMRVAERGEIPVFPPLLVFRYGENRGINFGLLDGDSPLTRWVLIAVSLAIVAAVVVWVARWHRDSGIMQVCAGLLAGGALGNVLDRLIFGYVLDFLNMSCCGIDNPYVFNVADIFVFAGAFGLIVFDGRGGKKAP